MRRIVWCGVVLCCGLPISRALAQQHFATLAGTFHDQAGKPVRGVRVTSDPGGALAISDSEGRFTMRGLAPARTRFVVQRLGYEPGEFSIDLKPDSTLDFDFPLTQLAVGLPGMESNATVTSPFWLKSFEDHRASQGGGHFFTRDDIERANPRQLSDVLRAVPGLRLSSDPNGQHTARMTRSNLGAFGDCPIQYWIDGARADEVEPDDVSPRDVEALEVYAGPATLPPEYRTRFGTSACGTVVIWTRKP